MKRFLCMYERTYSNNDFKLNTLKMLARIHFGNRLRISVPLTLTFTGGETDLLITNVIFPIATDSLANIYFRPIIAPKVKQ